MRGQEFFVLTRRERRAYPSAVCKERATPSARKRTAALWVAPHWAWGVVAPQSQNAGGYAPSSRLAPGPMRRNACIDNSVSQYWRRLNLWLHPSGNPRSKPGDSPRSLKLDLPRSRSGREAAQGIIVSRPRIGRSQIADAKSTGELSVTDAAPTRGAWLCRV